MKTIFECLHVSDFIDLRDKLLKLYPLEQVINPLPIDFELSHAGLTVRTQNFFLGYEIKTIRDLIELTEFDLLKMPNIGRKSLEEIQQFLSRAGYKLKERL